MRIEERLIRWLGIVLLIVLILISVVLLIFLSKKISNLAPGGWDFLAFTGAIIGGTITWLGIRITLKYNANEKFLESYSKQIRVLYYSVEQLKFISNVPNFMVFTDNEITRDLLQYKIETLESFNQSYIEEFSKLLGVVEWKVLHVIDLKSKKFGGLIHAKHKFDRNEKDFSNVNKFIDECYESASEIFALIESHKNDLIKRYYEVKK